MPWKSRLEPYREEILRLYEIGYSIKVIRDWLKNNYGLSVCKNTIRNFIAKQRSLRHHGDTKKLMYELGLLPRLTVYSKRPFDRTNELPYYCGFSEDFNVERYHHQIRIASGSTHPSFIALSMKLFRPYGHIILVPTFKKRFKVFTLQITILLDRSFEFLANYKDDRITTIKCLSRDEMWKYLAGLIDSEGSISVLINNRKDYYYPILCIQMKNQQILQWLEENFGGGFYLGDRLAKWHVYGKECIELLKKLELKHMEKLTKRSIILNNLNDLKRAKHLLKQYQQLVERQKAGFQLFMRKVAERRKTLTFSPLPFPSKQLISSSEPSYVRD